MSTPHPNHDVLDAFYRAFANRDHATMRSMYAQDATFKDPVFTLDGAQQVGDMWEMLCTRGKDLSLSYEILEAHDTGGKVRWKADYTFSLTGRMVHNVIDATLTIRDGEIVEHVDVFDFWKWSRQALGAPGMLLGWSSMLQGKVSDAAMQGLEVFAAKKS